jgi:hypothetical protein
MPDSAVSHRQKREREPGAGRMRFFFRSQDTSDGCHGGKMKRIGWILGLIGFLGAGRLAGAEAPLLVVRDCPEFRKVADDAAFNAQFLEYMRFASDKSPDGRMVFAMLGESRKTLDMISTIFHEQVELGEWMRLGHRFADITTVEYNQKHYLEVFPIAHRASVIEEFALLQYYAHKACGIEVPEVAFNLVSPLIEKFAVSVDRFQNRLRFNPEYLAQMRYVSDSAIEMAMGVYETGGYVYKERDRILTEAKALAQKSRPR